MCRLNVIFKGGDDELDRFETEEHDERREEEEDFWRTTAAATWEGLGAVLTLRIPTHCVPTVYPLTSGLTNQPTHTNAPTPLTQYHKCTS